MADHIHHLRVALRFLSEAKYDIALERASALFRNQANLAGKPQMFNVTMTVFWMRVMDIAREELAAEGTLEDLLVLCPELADKNLPLLYYSRFRLMSDEARQRFLAPDLRVMPATLADLRSAYSIVGKRVL